MAERVNSGAHRRGRWARAGCSCSCRSRRAGSPGPIAEQRRSAADHPVARGERFERELSARGRRCVPEGAARLRARPAGAPEGRVELNELADERVVVTVERSDAPEAECVRRVPDDRGPLFISELTTEPFEPCTGVTERASTRANHRSENVPPRLNPFSSQKLGVQGAHHLAGSGGARRIGSRARPWRGQRLCPLRSARGAEPLELTALPGADSSNSRVPLRPDSVFPRARDRRGPTPHQKLPQTAHTAPTRTPPILLRSRPSPHDGRQRETSCPRACLGLAGEFNRRSFPSSGSQEGAADRSGHGPLNRGEGE